MLLAAMHARAEDYKPPSVEATLAAVGSLEHLPPVAQRLLVPDGDFPLLDAPLPGDWLAEHEESGQSYDDFVVNDADTFIPARNVIYLQPVGEFPAESSPRIAALAEYAACFFQLKVVVLPRARTDERTFTRRINENTHKPQILSSGVLVWLRDHVPADAHCLIAVTMSDLYPAESWNYVFGQASLRDRVGVFSFARDDPAFFGEARPEGFARLILERSAKTLAHEITHTFGLEHCIYFRCVENGANNQAESDRAPQHLCPVCLRKLYHATGFDLEKRYRDLQRFYSMQGWGDEAAWVARQVAKAKADTSAAEALAPPVIDVPKSPATNPAPAPAPVPAPPLPSLELPPLGNKGGIGTPSALR